MNIPCSPSLDHQNTAYWTHSLQRFWISLDFSKPLQALTQLRFSFKLDVNVGFQNFPRGDDSEPYL